MRASALLLAAAVIASIVSSSPAAAATITVDPLTFAESSDYCGDGLHTVTGTLKVKGDDGVIRSFSTGSCSITLSGKAKLKFDDSQLGGTGSFLVSGGDGGSRVEFKDSSLSMTLGISIAPSCCDPLLEKSRVKVTASSISSNTGPVSIIVSQDADGGRIDILKGSTILAGNDVGDNINLQASDVPVDADSGKITVKESTLNAGGQTLHIGTRNGTIKVLENTLNYGTVSISANGGKCTTEDNTPTNPLCT